VRLGVEDKEMGISVPDWAINEDPHSLQSRSNLLRREARPEGSKGSATHFRALLGKLLEKHQEVVASVMLVSSIQVSGISFAYPSREVHENARGGGEISREISKRKPCYNSVGKGKIRGDNIFTNFSRDFQTGTCYNFVGKGKSTLLKCFADNMLTPQSGTISFPHYTRKVFVARSATLMPGLLLDNAMTMVKRRDESKEEAAWKLLGILDLGSSLLRKNIFCSGENLTPSETKKVCIVRAIMSGVKVLILDRVCEGMSGGDVQKVEGVLRRWLEEEGEGRRTILAAGLEWGKAVMIE
jgi:ABC-type iron transport system FetAB ATPase subunit